MATSHYPHTRSKHIRIFGRHHSLASLARHSSPAHSTDGGQAFCHRLPPQPGQIATAPANIASVVGGSLAPSDGPLAGVPGNRGKDYIVYPPAPRRRAHHTPSSGGPCRTDQFRLPGAHPSPCLSSTTVRRPLPGKSPRQGPVSSDPSFTPSGPDVPRPKHLGEAMFHVFMPCFPDVSYGPMLPAPDGVLSFTLMPRPKDTGVLRKSVSTSTNWNCAQCGSHCKGSTCRSATWWSTQTTRLWDTHSSGFALALCRSARNWSSSCKKRCDVRYSSILSASPPISMWWRTDWAGWSLWIKSGHFRKMLFKQYSGGWVPFTWTSWPRPWIFVCPDGSPCSHTRMQWHAIVSISIGTITRAFTLHVPACRVNSSSAATQPGVPGPPGPCCTLGPCSALAAVPSATCTGPPSSLGHPISILRPRPGVPQAGDIRTMDRISFLRQALLTSRPVDIVDTLLACYRSSSRRQQEVAWSAFQRWLPLTCSIVSRVEVLQFLQFLFSVKHLAPSTIVNYRAALQWPLEEAFHIDFSHPDFSHLATGFFHICPPMAPTVPQWNLSGVLRYCESIDHNTCSAQLLLLKTLGPTALASGNRAPNCPHLPTRSGRSWPLRHSPSPSSLSI